MERDKYNRKLFIIKSGDLYVKVRGINHMAAIVVALNDNPRAKIGTTISSKIHGEGKEQKFKTRDILAMFNIEVTLEPRIVIK